MNESFNNHLLLIYKTLNTLTLDCFSTNKGDIKIDEWFQ